MAKKTKANLEFLLVKAELKGIPERGLLRSRNLLSSPVLLLFFVANIDET